MEYIITIFVLLLIIYIWGCIATFSLIDKEIISKEPTPLDEEDKNLINQLISLSWIGYFQVKKFLKEDDD